MDFVEAGAKVIRVMEGDRTLKEAVDAALTDYVINRQDTFYLLGSAVGPHPFPTIVRTFQSIIGKEARKQILDDEALEAFFKLSKTEGIIPALESSNAIAYGIKLAKDLAQNKIIIINLSGRGDKDVAQVKDMMK